MQYINFHTHSKTTAANGLAIYNLPIIAMDEEPLVPYFSVGIHPWEISDIEHRLQMVEVKLQDTKVVAVGECGLDKIKGPGLNIQQEVFKKQVQLSEQYKKPVIIHCVKAYSEIIKLHKELKPGQPWIFHGFNSSKETMLQACKEGFFFSYGHEILKLNTRAHQAFLQTPLERIFFETDEKEMDISMLYKQAGGFRSIPVQKLASLVQRNFISIFNVDR